jgi:hypothetical protein
VLSVTKLDESNAAEDEDGADDGGASSADEESEPVSHGATCWPALLLE